MTWTRAVACLLLLLGTAATSCSVFTPDEAVDAAEEQWAALTPEVHDALGLRDQDEYPTGAAAEVWVITAESGLDVPDAAPAGSPGERTAHCLAVARALDGTGLQAFGWLPVGDQLLAAGPDTCVRGLGAGRWADDPLPPGPESTLERPGTLELGRVEGGRADLVGVALDLGDLSVQASSETPPWAGPVGTFDAQQFDEQLAALTTPVPTDLVVGDDQRLLLVVVPAGTTTTASATCAQSGPTTGSVAVEGVGSGISSATGRLDPDQVSDSAANCPGTATAELVPDDRVTTLGGAVDVFRVDIAGAGGIRVQLW